MSEEDTTTIIALIGGLAMLCAAFYGYFTITI